jgi:ribose 5-phosphate isomerase A
MHVSKIVVMPLFEGSSQSILLEKSFEEISKDIVRNHIGDNSILIGLGSGRAVSKFVDRLPGSIVSTCEFICTSLQIKVEAERKGLKVLDEMRIPLLDLVIDGADQINKKFCMLKGGGGALLREKILFYASKKTIIIGDSSKFVREFSKPLPLEVLPFARTAVIQLLVGIGGKPALRTMERGYPFLTENGNIILDTVFPDYGDVPGLEKKIKEIPGIVETGFFIKPASIYYKVLDDGSFQKFDNTCGVH